MGLLRASIDRYARNYKRRGGEYEFGDTANARVISKPSPPTDSELQAERRHGGRIGPVIINDTRRALLRQSATAAGISYSALLDDVQQIAHAFAPSGQELAATLSEILGAHPQYGVAQKHGRGGRRPRRRRGIQRMREHQVRERHARRASQSLDNWLRRHESQSLDDWLRLNMPAVEP